MWGAIAGAVLGFGRAPGTPPALAVVAVDGSCGLAAVGARPPCRCEDWPGPLRLLAGLRVPLASASAGDLEAVPGIGPVRARSIVAQREAAGPLAVDALLRVPGIGPGTLERVRPFLRSSVAAPDCDAADWS